MQFSPIPATSTAISAMYYSRTIVAMDFPLSSPLETYFSFDYYFFSFNPIHAINILFVFVVFISRHSILWSIYCFFVATFVSTRIVDSIKRFHKQLGSGNCYLKPVHIKMLHSGVQLQCCLLPIHYNKKNRRERQACFMFV